MPISTRNDDEVTLTFQIGTKRSSPMRVGIWSSHHKRHRFGSLWWRPAPCDRHLMWGICWTHRVTREQTWLQCMRFEWRVDDLPLCSVLRTLERRKIHENLPKFSFRVLAVSLTIIAVLTLSFLEYIIILILEQYRHWWEARERETDATEQVTTLPNKDCGDEALNPTLSLVIIQFSHSLIWLVLASDRVFSNKIYLFCYGPFSCCSRVASARACCSCAWWCAGTWHWRNSMTSSLVIGSSDDCCCCCCVA